MGQAQSDAFAAAVPDCPGTATKPSADRSTKLYKFVSGGVGKQGAWTLASGNARPSFYNRNEDSGKKKPDWYLEIEGSDIDVPVNFNELEYEADFKELRITFGAMGDIWALRFGNENQFRNFANDLNDKTFINLTGQNNDEDSRAKELGGDFGSLLFQHDIDPQAAIAPMDVDSEPDVPAPAELRERSAHTPAKDGDISGVLIGAGENNYLLRRGHVDVLRNIQGGVEDKQISFALTPQRGTGRGGAGGASTPTLTPSRVLLANAERNFIMLTPDQREQMSVADIETGQVVQTYKFEKDGCDIPMLDIHHDNKSAQLEVRSTFLGLDNNRLCRWDTRDPHGIVAKSPLAYAGGKDYSRGTNFTCMATSGDGFVSVGSKDGKVRLYSSKSLTKANTAIPGLGSAITAIDVTYDGKYVVATADKYLMIVKTTYQDEQGRDCNGFSSRMGGRGAVPRLLRLKPEDTARTGGKPFQKGKFTWITEAGITERWVVAQVGNFSVVWNFKRIRSMPADGISYGGMPSCTDYILSARDEDVVDAAFLHPRYAKGANETALVVATSHNLFNLGA